MSENPKYLGPFKVDDHGLLSPSTPESFPGFAVRWRDRLVHARMLQRNPSGDLGRLDLSTRLGRVPSTAHAPPPSPRRSDVLVAIRHLPGLLPQGWRLELAADHSIIVQAQTALTLPVSAVSLVTEMAMFLLTLTPYLELLDEEGIGFADGTVKT